MSDVRVCRRTSIRGLEIRCTKLTEFTECMVCKDSKEAWGLRVQKVYEGHRNATEHGIGG